MMTFVLLALSITVGMLLASFIACMIMLSTPVMNWYMRKVQKITYDFMSDFEKEVFDED